MMRKFTDEQLKAKGLSLEMPRHVAIIMDGNGRWANSRGLPRAFGHRAGVERLRGIIRNSSDMGIEALSLYAFSTENWKRPQKEISTLTSLFIEYFNKEIDELHANDVRIRALGDTSKFVPDVHNAIVNAHERTRNNSGLKLNIALNYGSRDEMVTAVKNIASDVRSGGIKPDQIDENMILDNLYTYGLPDVDMIVRTGGEKRLSNFLLFQAAYAELIFVDDFWPDFTDEKYVETIKEFQRRTRRYGGLK